MKASDIVKTLAALALVGGCPTASWQQLLVRLAALSLTGLSESDLQQVFQTYLLLKSKGAQFVATVMSVWDCFTIHMQVKLERKESELSCSPRRMPASDKSIACIASNSIILAKCAGLVVTAGC